MPVYIKKYISQETDTNSITSVYRHNGSEDVYGLISISNAPDGYAHRASKFAWEAIIESYVTSPSTIEGIKRAVSAGSKKVLELIKNDKSIDSKGLDLNFAIIVIKDATAYLGHFGEQEIYVFKDGEVVNVTEVLDRNRVVAASFAVGITDTVVFASPGLLRNIVKDMGRDELSEILLEAYDTVKSGEGFLVLSRSIIDQDFSNIEDIGSDNPVVSGVEVEEGSGVVESTIDTTQTIDEMSASDSELEVVSDGVDVNMEEDISNVGSVNSVSEITVGKKSLKDIFSKEKVEEYRVIIVSFWGKFRSFVLLIWNKLLKWISPISDWLSRFSQNLSNSVWRMIDNRYGRQVWYKRIKSKLSTMKLSSNSSAYGMKIDGYKETSLRGKRTLTLALIILIIIVVLGGINLSVKAREARELHREASAVFESVERYIKQSEDNIHTDTSSANGYILQAKEQLDKVKDKELSVADRKTLDTLISNVTGIEDRLAKRVWVTESDGTLSTYLSTRLEFGSNSNPTDMTIYKDDYQVESLYIVDNGLKGVYRVNLYDKSVIKIPDKNGLIKSPKFIDIGVNGVYVYDEISGVVRSGFDAKTGSLDFINLTGLGADDLGINDVTEFAVFAATDNVYLLSPSQKTIFKSNFVGSGYTLPYTFITSEDLSNAEDFFGDNVAIYVTGRGNVGVNRFVPINGEDLPISITGVSEAVSAVTVGFTAPALDNPMYLFEGGDIKRFLSLQKPNESVGDTRHPNELLHLKEYRYRGEKEDVLSNVRDLVIDTQGKYMYILDGSVVRTIEVSE